MALVHNSGVQFPGAVLVWFVSAAAWWDTRVGAVAGCLPHTQVQQVQSLPALWLKKRREVGSGLSRTDADGGYVRADNHRPKRTA